MFRIDRTDLICKEKMLAFAKEHAQEVMHNRQTDIDYARVQAELAGALAQLRAIQKLREKVKK